MNNSLNYLLLAGVILSLSVIYQIPDSYYQNIEAQEIDTTNQEKDNCITYNSSENLISINCKNISFADILTQQKQQSPTLNNNGEKIWLLYAGIKVEKDASLNINSNDVTWLKIVPSKNTPNAIEVDGSLKVDSVKITSWNPETNDFVKFPKDAKDAEDIDAEKIYASILRPYIKVNSDATGPTIIQNSELAYLGYDCGGCGGITFNGGKYSILQNNDIHHIYKGFYSKGMGYMLIEGNRVYGNDKYGIDPHTGTHDMLIINNTVYDNYNAGIICSLDCYNLLIEGNTVYNNGHDDFERGIAVSRNVYDSIIRNNIVYDEDRCIHIGRDSYNNKIYDNVVSNCVYGIKLTTSSFNNEIYNNKIEKVDYAFFADEAATKNVFHSNTVIDAKVDLALEDETSKGNIFKNNRVSFDTLEKAKNDESAD
ncbi:MAG TPA: right-handed parallel beta-helix repeat-containing protein [Nitrososphaeraceae archaeon]|nr:right-handed parallel beta-helix repeat-containing protein [Nitrososphaeraceae archaeon]